MAVKKGRRIVYRHNPSLGFRHTHGRKVEDPQTGFWTYEAFLVPDDYGVMSDVRGDGLDRREDDSSPQR